jgi:hypothetical protein
MASLSLRTRRLRARGINSRLGRAWARRVFLRPAGVRASLTTAMTGTNNDITFRAQYGGTAGNSLRVRIVVAGASTPLSVSRSGNDITINSATSGASAATSTARQVIDAVNANKDIVNVLTCETAAANDGTGVVTALAFTNLTGGAG